ncbi:MAG TPA: hypothetical protein VND64_34660 [Pirellulales bacterium]|nr:hypothetical protein [Pirellulales bacterium]
MSNVNDQTSFIRRPVPVWLAAIIIGSILDGGVTFQVMRAVGYELPYSNTSSGLTENMRATIDGMGVDPTQCIFQKEYEKHLRAMMARMGGGGSGMMGGGTGDVGGAREKISLTSLVGKIEFLTRLQFELDPGQSLRITATLAELDRAEEMTCDEANAHLNTIHEILNQEQKTTLAAMESFRGETSSGRGMDGIGGAAGGPAGGVSPPGMMKGGMMGGGGSPPDENPFVQETNQKRLRDLLDRLRPSSAETPDAATEVAETTEVPTTTEETESPQP